jgi:hypothetical protein
MRKRPQTQQPRHFTTQTTNPELCGAVDVTPALGLCPVVDLGLSGITTGTNNGRPFFSQQPDTKIDLKTEKEKEGQEAKT